MVMIPIMSLSKISNMYTRNPGAKHANVVIYHLALLCAMCVFCRDGDRTKAAGTLFRSNWVN